MKLIIDHKKFGCKTIFQDWVNDIENVKDVLRLTDSIVNISHDFEKIPQIPLCDIVVPAQTIQLSENNKENPPIILYDTTFSNNDNNSLQTNEFECKICFHLFNTDANLKIHESSHNKCKTFICDICQKSFYTFYHLKNHMRKHDGCTPFKCEYCRKYFTTGTGLSIHMKKHIGGILQHCNVCEQTFPAPYHLKKHMIKHTKEKHYKCIICKKRFSRQGSLHVHQRLHSAESPRYKCAMCPKRFHWQSNLKAHQPTHYDGSARCDICKRKFNNTLELDMHAAFHRNDVRFQCVWCRKSYSSRHKLHYHIKNSHVKMPSFQCDQCDKSFKFSQQLKIHRIVHTDEKPRCYICDKTFLTKYNLQSHLMSHVSSKSFECDICGIKFTYKRNLYIHLKRHVMAREQHPNTLHAGFAALKDRKKKMKKLQCDTCGREFAYQKSLEKCDHKKLVIVGKDVNKCVSNRKQRRVKLISNENSLLSDESLPILHSNYLDDIKLINHELLNENNFKVQVNIVLGDAEQPFVPLWELNIPLLQEENQQQQQQQPYHHPNFNGRFFQNGESTILEVAERDVQVAERIDFEVVLQQPTPPSPPPLIPTPIPSPPRFERSYVCGVNDEVEYFYYPSYLNNNNFAIQEPIDFSMGFSPVSHSKYSPFTVNKTEEPIDYSFHNVRFVNNVTYREL